MKPFVMGLETELGVSGRHDRRCLPPDRVFSMLCRELQQELPCLPDLHGAGIYTSLGNRFYLDCGGHPEWSSPESFTPSQLVAHDKASERLLQGARERVQRRLPGIQLSLLKSNLCPIAPDEVTYGCHEAYTVWVPGNRLGEVAEQLIPHITSRIVYAGAGCLSTHPQGTGYELSQRARHLVRVTGGETTAGRAIFSTRLKSSDVSPAGWTRVHLIAKDSHRSSLGTYLTCGTTAVLILLINAGHRVGVRLQLADPVQSLRSLSLDPSLRVRLPLADGRRLTALEIQEGYLAECDRHSQRTSLPPWAYEVLRVWRCTIEALAADPFRLAHSLDIYRKLRVHQQILDRAGVDWPQFREAAGLLAQLRRKFPPAVVQAVLSDNPNNLPVEASSAFGEASKLVSGAGRLDRLRLAVRMQMFEFSYHEVGGIADQVAKHGRVDARLPSEVLRPEELERSLRETPAEGRAASRGRFIREHHREGKWGCSWGQILDLQSGTAVDLGDPFQAREPTVGQAPPDEPAQTGWSLHRLLAELWR